ncbi:MAG: hypothetical protein WD342_14770 [Verrucomicrobiales bacterium]
MEQPTTQAGEAVLQCPKCRSGLNVNRATDRIEEKCPVCRGELSLTVFPRLFAAPSNEAAPATSTSGSEASCAFYPELKAEKICDRCGCFLSGKAAVRWDGRDFCVPCLHWLREEEKAVDFVARVDFHENRALALVTWLAPLSLFTAPVALYLLVRYRKESPGFVPRGRGRWWLAAFLSVAWLIAWLAVIVIWVSLVVDDLL